MPRIRESGRSMVEMLGVLAIAGVLSVGGILGFATAMDRLRGIALVETAAGLSVLAMAGNRQLDSASEPDWSSFCGRIVAEPGGRGTIYFNDGTPCPGGVRRAVGSIMGLSGVGDATISVSAFFDRPREADVVN
ncbi:MAG: hypothetical protein PHX68_02490 [Alphaproteobacteria bacterium]|nr:hypothetical protein [Alphaproteobacteria bacterium]